MSKNPEKTFLTIIILLEIDNNQKSEPILIHFLKNFRLNQQKIEFESIFYIIMITLINKLVKPTLLSFLFIFGMSFICFKPSLKYDIVITTKFFLLQSQLNS